MKKKKRIFCGAFLVASSLATMIWAGFKIGADNLADTDIKTPVSEKQALLNEFFPSDPKYATLGLFWAIGAIIGMGLINKSKEK